MVNDPFLHGNLQALFQVIKGGTGALNPTPQGCPTSRGGRLGSLCVWGTRPVPCMQSCTHDIASTQVTIPFFPPNKCHFTFFPPQKCYFTAFFSCARMGHWQEWVMTKTGRWQERVSKNGTLTPIHGQEPSQPPITPARPSSLFENCSSPEISPSMMNGAKWSKKVEFFRSCVPARILP